MFSGASASVEVSRELPWRQLAVGTQDFSLALSVFCIRQPQKSPTAQGPRVAQKVAELRREPRSPGTQAPVSCGPASFLQVAVKLSGWRWRGRQALRLYPRAEQGPVVDTVLALLEKLVCHAGYQGPGLNPLPPELLPTEETDPGCPIHFRRGFQAGEFREA